MLRVDTKISILATRIRVWFYDPRIPLDFRNRIILRIYVEGLQQFSWWIDMHWRTICFLSSNWFLFFPLLYSYNTYCNDQESFQIYFLSLLSDWLKLLLKIFQSWIPFWISSNFGYEQTTMIRLSFGIVTLVVIAIQLGFEKCSMLVLWFAIRIENLTCSRLDGIVLKLIKFISLSTISKTNITAIDIWVRAGNEFSTGISGPHELLFWYLKLSPVYV